MSLTDIEKKIRRLDTSKPSHTFDISTKMLKQKIDFFSPFKLGYINQSIMSFTSILKSGDVTLVYKKDSEYGKSNYQPISLLPNLSKTVENILYNQIFSFFENIFCKYKIGFRKGFNLQNCLVAMIEKFKDLPDRGEEYAALLKDLSLVLDCLPHNLIIPKLHEHGF